jgi:hypothetical protein
MNITIRVPCAFRKAILAWEAAPPESGKFKNKPLLKLLSNSFRLIYKRQSDCAC